MDLLNIENTMATRIEYRVKQAIEDQFPNINFTTEVSDNPVAFPNVYVHEERMSEAGTNLWNKAVEAMDFAIQVVIRTNTTKSDILAVRNACIDAIKQDGFRVIINEPRKTNNIYQCTLHFYGVRGAGDNFY